MDDFSLVSPCLSNEARPGGFVETPDLILAQGPGLYKIDQIVATADSVQVSCNVVHSTLAYQVQAMSEPELVNFYAKRLHHSQASRDLR